MNSPDDKPPDSPAALRQRRRRQRLRALGANTINVVLTKEQGLRLDALVSAEYAPGKSAVLAKGLDEAFDRLLKQKSLAKG